MQCFRFSIFGLLVATLVLVVVPGISQAQMFGFPAASPDAAWNEVAGRLSEEKPMACVIWNEAGTLNPEGNASDKWFSDGKLQTSLGKLKEAITALAVEQGPPLLGRFAKDVGWKLISKAGMLEVENFNVDEESVSASLILHLGEDKRLIGEFFDDFMLEVGIPAIASGKDKVYQVPEIPIPVVMGVHSDKFVAAVGQGQWQKIVDRIDDTPRIPDWLQTKLRSLPMTRRGNVAFGNIEALLETLPPEVTEDPEFVKIDEVMKFDSMKSFIISTGADSASNIAMFHIECDKEGLTSIFDVPAIEEKKLKEMPGDSISAIAIRMSPGKLLDLVQGVMPPELYERGINDFVEETGLDLQKDIIEHLEGTVRTYQSGMVISPKQFVMIRIKDELKFREPYERITDALRLLAANRGADFVEQDKKGFRQYGFKLPVMSFYWALSGGELYLSTNSRAIGSHIRKASGYADSSVMSSELSEKILAQSKSMGLEGPIMVQHLDLDPITEIALPAAQSAFAFMPAEVTSQFNFGSDDFPPVDSLLGLRSTKSMIFKSSEGYTGISRYDTPVGVEFTTIGATGVGVGLLLPALQQAREAARRTSSMNNQRQLALALLNYHDAKGRFPSAYTTAADGTPLLSWRVEILPYLEQQELYDKFRHDEPWDSEHNIALLDEMPLLFENPSSMGRAGWTDYVAPISDDSIIAVGKGSKIGSITDGTSNTVLVMEGGQSNQVPWSSPQDMEIDGLESLDLDNGHPGVITCVFCDGSVQSIAKTISVEAFIHACKKSDGLGLRDAAGL